MPLDEILSMADALFPEDNVYGRSGISPSAEDTETTVLLNSAGVDLYGPDSILVFLLPTLLTLIRSAETKSDVAELRHLAAVLTDIDLDRLGYPPSMPWMDLHSPIEQPSNRSVLAPYAAAMQAAFGRLIAAQQRVFPAMPSPAWAY